MITRELVNLYGYPAAVCMQLKVGTCTCFCAAVGHKLKILVLNQFLLMDKPNLLACLTCTCTSARKWQRLSAYLAGLTQEYTSKSDWALKLPCLSLLGCLVRYPRIATKMADDLDFARRLRCFPTDAFTGLNQYVKKDIRLCLKNLQTVERKQKAKLRRRKQEKFWEQKHAAARRVSERATVALAMVVEAIRRKRLG